MHSRILIFPAGKGNFLNEVLACRLHCFVLKIFQSLIEYANDYCNGLAICNAKKIF